MKKAEKELGADVKKAEKDLDDEAKKAEKDLDKGAKDVNSEVKKGMDVTADSIDDTLKDGNKAVEDFMKGL